MLPLDRFDSEGWFSFDQEIFLTVFRVFLVKKHAAFKWKDAISGFPVSPGSAEALVRCGGKIKYFLVAYFLGNICAKKCRNRTVYVEIIASCKGGTFFETLCRRDLLSYNMEDINFAFSETSIQIHRVCLHYSIVRMETLQHTVWISVHVSEFGESLGENI